MRIVSIAVLTLVFLATCGCGGERDRGINRDKDRPRSTFKADPEERR